jgi:S-adenosylmethionine-diacylglycerol 3-amino-3-carboxypropyl transferase
MKSFRQTVNYASSNEDSGSEIRALRIEDRDVVLCITGSGARPLDLLTASPGKIVSIDFNPCQNFLLELKMAAIQQLEYREYLEFLGVTRSVNRSLLYRRIRGKLNAQALSFWDSHASIIRKGVIYRGRWERYFRSLAFCVGCVRPRLLKKIFSAETLSEQSALWRRKWANPVWRSFLRIISMRMVWKYAFGDPGFFLHVPESFSIHAYLENRFDDAFDHFLASGSPFARLLFFGKFDAGGVLPIHLREDHYDTLRKNLPRISIFTQPLDDYLNAYDGIPYQKFSLSDFASYTGPDQYSTIWEKIVRNSSPGAVVCERQFLVKRDPPDGVRSSIARDNRLEKELERTDNSIFYSFVIANVKGP